MNPSTFELTKKVLDCRVQLLSLVTATQLLTAPTEIKYPMVIASDITGTVFIVDDAAQYYSNYKKNHDDDIHGQFLILFAHMDFIRSNLPSCDGLEFISRVRHGFDTDDFPYDLIKKLVKDRDHDFRILLSDASIEACMDAIEKLFIYMKAAKKDPVFAKYLATTDNRCVIITDLPNLSPELLALKNDCEEAVAWFKKISPPYLFWNHVDRWENIRVLKENL